MSLIPGKRYEWPKSNIPADGKANGLFTGNYDKNNGNALLMTKNGDTWSVPERDCVLMKNRHNGIKKGAIIVRKSRTVFSSSWSRRKQAEMLDEWQIIASVAQQIAAKNK